MKLNREKIQVIATLAYTDQFQYPLSSDEVFKRLVEIKKFSSHFKKSIEMSRDRVDLVLSQLINEGTVVKKSGFFVLIGSEEFFDIRKKREEYSRGNLGYVKSFLNFIEKIPWIKAVGITGSQSMNNISHAQDDIDFIVITSLNRLWLVRPVIILYSFFAGKKALFWPLKKTKPKDKWCFNLWLDESALAMSDKKKNFYTAYEIMQIKWIYQQSNTVGDFYQKNAWIRDYLPNFSVKKSKVSLNFKSDSDWLGDVNEWFCKIQLGYLSWKIGLKKYMAEKNYAFLHLGDMKKQVYKRWSDKLSQFTKVNII